MIRQAISMLFTRLDYSEAPATHVHGRIASGRLLRRMATWTAYVTFVLCLVELAVRMLVVYGLGRPQIVRYDSVLGWANVVERRTERTRSDGGRWRITLDAAGRRVVTPAADPMLPHVLVLGDSFVFGDSIDQDDHFLHGLRRRAAVNVHNLGVVGYATDQELLAFRRAQEPCDTLLLMTYTANDLRDNLSSFESGGVRFKPKMTAVGDAVLAQPVTHPMLAWGRTQSYVTMLGLTALYRFWPELSLFDPVSFPARLEESIRLYLALVREIVDEATRRGVQRTVIVVWSFRSAGDNETLVARIGDTTRGRATVVNLDREFAQRVQDPSALYFSAATDPGQHWNERGHALLGAILADLLDTRDERGGLPQESSPTTSLQSAEPA
jgi:hypothetical protein